MLQWDVANGVARRSWSGNDKAREAIVRTQAQVRPRISSNCTLFSTYFLLQGTAVLFSRPLSGVGVQIRHFICVSKIFNNEQRKY